MSLTIRRKSVVAFAALALATPLGAQNPITPMKVGSKLGKGLGAVGRARLAERRLGEKALAKAVALTAATPAKATAYDRQFCRRLRRSAGRGEEGRPDAYVVYERGCATFTRRSRLTSGACITKFMDDDGVDELGAALRRRNDGDLRARLGAEPRGLGRESVARSQRTGPIGLGQSEDGGGTGAWRLASIETWRSRLAVVRRSRRIQLFGRQVRRLARDGQVLSRQDLRPVTSAMDTAGVLFIKGGIRAIWCGRPTAPSSHS